MFTILLKDKSSFIIECPIPETKLLNPISVILLFDKSNFYIMVACFRPADIAFM